MTAVFKRGDSFDYSGGPIEATLGGSAVSDFTGWVGASEVRRKAGGALIAGLSFDWLDAVAGTFRIHAPASTAAWPLGVAQMDVRLTAPGGEVITTGTATFTIGEAVTAP